MVPLGPGGPLSPVSLVRLGSRDLLAPRESWAPRDLKVRWVSVAPAGTAVKRESPARPIRLAKRDRKVLRAPLARRASRATRARRAKSASRDRLVPRASVASRASPVLRDPRARRERPASGFQARLAALVVPVSPGRRARVAAKARLARTAAMGNVARQARTVRMANRGAM